MNEPMIPGDIAGLFRYIESSPSSFHAVETTANLLKEAGYSSLSEQEAWALTPGKGYYITRNRSSLIAFRVPEGDFSGFMITASHSDAPTFKIKDSVEMDAPGGFLKLNVEGYGGMICSTWFDRPLSVAGRILCKQNGQIVTKLVHIDRDLLLIPNVAIHMNREINQGYKYNQQVDMLPLFGSGEKGAFIKLIAEEAGVTATDILGHDLFLYPRIRPAVWGTDGEFFSVPRLDDLGCAYATLKGFLDAKPTGNFPVYALFDNEEVGSGTKQGAKSTFLKDILHRAMDNLNKSSEDLARTVAGSLMLSADNGHAVHPNHPELADPVNHVKLNGGVVVKFSAAQKYTSDGVSAAIFRTICEKAEAPVQVFTNRSDSPGGSTLGNIVSEQVSLNAVDIGLPQLAMHSCYETGGSQDVGMMIRAVTEFYETSLDMGDGSISFK